MILGQGRIEHPRPPDYLWLMIGIWACLGLQLFQHFFCKLSLFMSKLCLFMSFLNPNLGLTE